MRTIVPRTRTFVLICALFLCSVSSFSQSILSPTGTFEAGFGFGPMFFLGDLGGNRGVGTKFVKDVNLELTKLSKNIFFISYPKEWLGIRLTINQSMVDGFDSIIRRKGGDEEFRYQRNLDFRSHLLEAYAAVEFLPTVFFEQYEELKGKFRPYLLAGVGVFHFNPKGMYYDATGKMSWVDLHPLRLEGQGMTEYPDRKPYKLTQIELPIGGGAKYYIKENFYIGFEVVHRKTFTDYIDDVSTTYIDAALFDKYLSPDQATMARQLYYRQGYSPNSSVSLNRLPTDPQRGSKNKDSFFSGMVRLGWRLNDRNSYGYRAGRQLLCPNYY